MVLDRGFHGNTWGVDLYPPLDATALDLTEDSQFAFGYSPVRRAGRYAEGATPTIGDADPAFRFASLFGDGARLTNIRECLADL